jgi:Domain of unknown function (DUF5047)
MWPVSTDWLAALGQPHGRYTRLEAWYAGARVASYQPESGVVQVTARNRIRRQLTAVLPESAWPATDTAPLNPYGTQLKVFQGIVGANGQLFGTEVPVFVGRLETVSRQRLSGQINISGLDPFADVNDALFESPRSPAAGTGVVSNIIGLVTEVRPDARIWDITANNAAIPAGMMWDQDRGQAIDTLAASIGAEVFARPDGITWVIRPVPTLTGTPVWTLAEGQGGALVRDSQSLARTDVANRVIVHVEQPGATPLLVAVTDDLLASLTRYGGPYGTVVRHYSNALITTTDQAQVAGRARLARSIGATRTRQVDTVPNPALEAGDLMTVSTAAGVERHIADSFGVPLAVTDVMTTQTRSTGTSVG